MYFVLIPRLYFQCFFPCVKETKRLLTNFAVKIVKKNILSCNFALMFV